MSEDIKRDERQDVTTIASGAALSGVIGFKDHAGGGIIMPATWTAASLGFQVSAAPGGTFVALYDAAGDLVELTVAASQAFPLPDELFGFAYFKLWSQTAGVDVNQAADREIRVSLKS